MRTLAIILVLGFVWQVSNASRKFEDIKYCVVDIRSPDDYNELESVQAIKDSENGDKLKEILKEKLIGFMTCLYQKQFGDKSLYNALKSFIEMDDKLSKEDATKMLETLNSCNITSAGDNLKLLRCVNIISLEFEYAMSTILDISYAAGRCFPKCQVTTGDMYKMDVNKNKVKGRLESVDEQKLGCFMACIFEEVTKNEPDSPTFLKTIADFIAKSQTHDENQKKEMLELLNKCDNQVAEVEDKTFELIKCVDMFKSPFADLYRRNK